MAHKIVLDNALNGVQVATYVNSKETLVWVSAGTADVLHDGDIICSLVVGDRKVIDGMPIGTEVVGQSTSDGTTLKFGVG